MVLKINSAYKIHTSAINLLASKNIQLNIIKNKSPFALATMGNPNVVIHPLSKIINGEFPQVKFCGPDCTFPNYNFTPEIGYSDYNIDSIIDGPVSSLVFINTTNNMAFIKYLESLYTHKMYVKIYGKKCDSLYYLGPTEEDTYFYYKNAANIAVDNEEEALKAIRVRSSGLIISSFDYINCLNFNDKNKKYKFEPCAEILKRKNWNTIFGNLLKDIGEDYD